MKTRRNACKGVGEETIGGNQDPSQAVTAHAHAFIAQDTREGSPRENPHARSMASRLRDFTTMSPLVYFGS
ncbi:hypothetical protein EJD97_020732 [Solanum chilense]|uniref:Uncharacterized protein n=1 Tax=Solanum chilense TaxID=4083 RepID=A0A6N2CFT1_SOLCI|nr:hypothetical protein EJD97_020732 [Solanum chilense]